MAYNADLREILEKNNAGVKFRYKGHEYMIITGIIIDDLTTGQRLMLGIDF